MPKLQLSKSDYILYLKHPAWLWLKKNDKSKLPEPDANLQALFDSGNLFESIVEQQFVGLSRLGFENYQEYLDLPARTAELLKAGDKLISQGRFEHEQLTCICDVVEQVAPGELELWEIKASTSVKPEHIEDLAFQMIVLEGEGYKVRKVGVVHCNNRYARDGDVDPAAIGMRQDVTEQVRAKLSRTAQEIEKAVKVMSQATMPDPSPSRARGGGFYEWLEIYKTLRPEEAGHSMYNLCQLNSQLLAELQNRGITELADIPDNLKLKPAQTRQIAAVKRGELMIQPEKISWFLKKLTFPLYFFDYETLSSVVPPFDGLRPYQQLPFQYSLHILHEPGGELEHKEYLHTSTDNPGPALLAQMKQDIGATGTVLVWYDKFEKGCNDLLARLWPDYGEFLVGVNERIVDLMVPFSNGWYAHADFCGSASIKKVLPVVVPELSYSGMAIAEGASAQRLWMQTVLGGVDQGKDELMANLREYCKLDTLAMVKIYEHLAALASPQTPVHEQLSLL